MSVFVCFLGSISDTVRLDIDSDGDDGAAIARRYCVSTLIIIVCERIEPNRNVVVVVNFDIATTTTTTSANVNTITTAAPDHSRTHIARWIRAQKEHRHELERAGIQSGGDHHRVEQQQLHYHNAGKVESSCTF